MAEGGASIQGDKEFVRIHYRILEQLALAPLTGGELRCLMFLLRKTYGWQKKEDKISLSQWADGTGMKRQNVWNILQSLLKRNMIYTKTTGPKRAATWGFNKYYETWQFGESVMPEHDSSVMAEDDSCEQSVMPEHDKSVIPPHERTKETKESSKAAIPAADESEKDDSEKIVSIARQAYAVVGRIAPSMRSDDGKSVILTAAQLVELYGYASCVRGLSTLKERNDAMVRKNARNGIRAPIAYLRTILEDEATVPVAMNVISAVNFSIEEIL